MCDGSQYISYRFPVSNQLKEIDTFNPCDLRYLVLSSGYWVLTNYMPKAKKTKYPSLYIKQVLHNKAIQDLLLLEDILE